MQTVVIQGQQPENKNIPETFWPGRVVLELRSPADTDLKPHQVPVKEAIVIVRMGGPSPLGLSKRKWEALKAASAQIDALFKEAG